MITSTGLPLYFIMKLSTNAALLKSSQWDLKPRLRFVLTDTHPVCFRKHSKQNTKDTRRMKTGRGQVTFISS